MVSCASQIPIMEVKTSRYSPERKVRAQAGTLSSIHVVKKGNSLVFVIECHGEQTTVTSRWRSEQLIAWSCWAIEWVVDLLDCISRSTESLAQAM